MKVASGYQNVPAFIKAPEEEGAAKAESDNRQILVDDFQLIKAEEINSA